MFGPTGALGMDVGSAFLLRQTLGSKAFGVFGKVHGFGRVSVYGVLAPMFQCRSWVHGFKLQTLSRVAFRRLGVLRATICCCSEQCIGAVRFIVSFPLLGPPLVTLLICRA